MPIHRPAGKRRDRQIAQSLEGLNALLRNAATPDEIGHITEAVRLWLTRAEGEALRREREREYEGFEAGKTETVDVTFCPPSGEGKPLKTGGGGGLEAPEDTGRIQQLEAMLDAHGFAGSYDKKIGRCTGSGFDRFPYYLYTFVSGAQGQILVSPGSDSGTFLSDDIRPPEAYALPKEQLRKLPGIQFVRYDSADQWDATILGFLGTFYRDRESILKDLKSFAEVVN